ncbi:MAG TPA: histidinol dehydrogenase, partial [Bacillales bacterium]|nr:histidinol dehydrogenase [Bacillales bacterium]
MKVIELNGDEISFDRNLDNGTEQQRQAVVDIIADVRQRGDAAVLALTERFDGVRLDRLRVDETEIDAAYAALDPSLIETIREAAAHIRDFHERQVRASWSMTKPDGSRLGQQITPLDAVGVYVPGGTAMYPSSVLMGVVPAKVAGVARVAVTTPPAASGAIAPAVLVAAREAGADEVYKAGGAQAVAALAYGTDSIGKVDKIVGPGNIFVALAKREVFGAVDIDSIAGPSEIAVIADDSANPRWLAADLLSQAEHDTRAAAVLFTPSRALAERVADEVARQLEDLPRRDIAAQAIADNGAIYVVRDVAHAVACVNAFAPEHLEVVVEDAEAWLGEIRHAGAIFLGPYSTEPVGDYFAGPNHVLPTSGTARFSSPLGVDDFVKKSSVIAYSERAMRENGGKIAALARLEGLEAHARAVEMRN